MTEGMSPPSATWLEAVTLERLDRRFGADRVDQTLQVAREERRSYAAPPHWESGARLVASFHDPMRRLKVAVRWQSEAELEMACTCSPGRSFVCPHTLLLLIDLAVHPGLACAIGSGDAVDAWTRGLDAARALAHETRTLDERLAQWLPSPPTDDQLDLDVEVVRLPRIGAAEEQPAVLLRHRKKGTRKLLRPREVVDLRLPPSHRRIVELTTPSHVHKDALVATRAQASLLLQLLRERMHVFTGGFRGRLRFEKALAVPAIVRHGERLVACWKTADGEAIAGASDTLLFQGPCPFLARATDGAIYGVAPEVDLDVAAGFARVPSLPFTEVTSTKIGRALLARGRSGGVELPSRTELGLPPLEAPVFALRIEGAPLSVEASLRAIYRGATFELGAKPRDEELGDGRDLEGEGRALALVAEAGLVFEDGLGLRAPDDRAVELWRTGLERLRTSRDPEFTIEVSASLARTTIGAPAVVRVHVESRSGWLETALEFSTGALAIELSRIRAALVANRRWIALDDGTLAQIGDHVASLVEDIASLGTFEDGSLRLPLRQIGRVGAWADRFDGKVSAEVEALRARVRAKASRSEPDLPNDLRATLRPYQRQGLAWLQLLRELGTGGVLADDMGLGKTLMSLAFLARWKEDDGPAPTLVVCPTSLVGNWAREAARFTPGLRVLLLHGSPQERRRRDLSEADLVITTYGLLRRDIDDLGEVEFRAVVLDEAQNVKNAESLTSRAAARLDGRMVLALTGTPIENRLAELWSLLDLAVPGLLGNSDDFAERYEIPIAHRPDGDVAAHLRQVVRPFVLRRTKRDVLPELPEKIEVERGCSLSPRERKAYDALALAVRESVRKDDRGGPRARMSVLTAILRLRQMACDPRLVDPERDGDAPRAITAKRAAFLEVVRELVREGRRALVFSQFVGLLQLWRRDLDSERVPYEYLDGSTTDRDAVVARFQEGAAPLFLISLKAGGAGLNLTAADTVIHCDPWWNPAVEEQATDRAHRIGQARAVTVVRLVTLGTIEEKVGLLKEKKRELAAAALGDATGEAFVGLDEIDLDVLLGDAARSDDAGQATEEASEGEVALAEDAREAAPALRWVPALEIDALRELAKTVIGSGMPKKDFARRVGYPAARLGLLLVGHRVPIASDVAERIRTLAAERLPPHVLARLTT